MGDPKRRRKQYKTPLVLWQKARIDDEKELIKEYGLKNKKEIWKMNSFLSSFANQAKKLITATTPQTQLEKKQLLKKLSSLGLVSAAAELDEILALDLRKILERRLQTLVFKKSLAKTPMQARQLITHGHICIGNKKITVPSYLVRKSEEGQIRFVDKSAFNDSEHPERVQVKEAPVTKAKKIKEEAKEKKPAKEEKKQEKKEEKPKEKAEAKPKEKKEESPKQEK